MQKRTTQDVTEILLHQGEDALPFGAVSPPIFQTSIFSFPSYEAFQNALADEPSHYIYSRGNNPTVNLCEEKIAALEHTERAKLVTSGCAAATCAILSCLKGDDHIVCVADAYDWNRWFIETWLKRFGVTSTFVDGRDSKEFEHAIRPNTRLIYLESPTTFTFKLQNLKEVADIARNHRIKTVIDNTWATPFFQNPIDFGIDYVVHSCSKYIGGNSDVVSGVVCGTDKDITHLFKTEFSPLGPTPDPFQAWLIIRNLRTLHIRMPVHYENALAVASFLEKHPAVESVLYPMLPSFEQHDLALRQMRGGSGLFSFRLKTKNIEDVKKFTNKLHLFKRAVSWGGYESLVFPAGVKFRDDAVPSERLGLVRIHVGIETKELLIADLAQALEGLPEK